VILQWRNGRAWWLGRWNRRWCQFSAVGGHKRPGETYRECLHRELLEELGIEPERNCAVSDPALAHWEFVAFSMGQLEWTAYSIELLGVQLLSKSIIQHVTAGPFNRWLNEDEIALGEARDGLPVSELMRLVLSNATTGKSGVGEIEPIERYAILVKKGRA
jgi:ADP-ribose pyrophosphatase YjhB (NUDIX family)